MRILIADDEREIRQILKILLENNSYEVVEAEDGPEAVSILKDDKSIDLCIMDVMMPNMSGVEATCQIRKFSSVPILFLTARSMNSDKAAAYGSGGDDYLVKPFSPDELIMKIDALTRRYNLYGIKEEDFVGGERLSCGVVVDIEGRRVFKNGVSVDMRDKEIDVLIHLVKNRGTVVSPSDLYSCVWEEKPLPSSANNVTVHILNLRRKLEDNSSMPKIIKTVWGKGYQIDREG